MDKNKKAAVATIPQPALVDCMLDAKDLPGIVYYVHEDDEAFRRPRFISAPRNQFILTPNSVDEFHESVKQHGSLIVPTPWISVFANELDAKLYVLGSGEGHGFTVCEVTTEGWIARGIVVVKAPDMERAGKRKPQSELLVLHCFPRSSVVRGKLPEEAPETDEPNQSVTKKKHTSKKPPKRPAGADATKPNPEGSQSKKRGNKVVRFTDPEPELTQDDSPAGADATMSNPQSSQSKKRGSKGVRFTDPEPETSQDDSPARQILADEWRMFLKDPKAGHYSWRYGYLIDWDPGNGTPWKPSWNEKEDTDKDLIARYTAKKSKWEEDAKTRAGRTIIENAKVKEILFDDKKINQGVEKTRYLIQYEGDIQPGWRFEKSVDKDLIQKYQKKIEKWRVWSGEG